MAVIELRLIENLKLQASRPAQAHQGIVDTSMRLAVQETYIWVLRMLLLDRLYLMLEPSLFCCVFRCCGASFLINHAGLKAQ